MFMQDKRKGQDYYDYYAEPVIYELGFFIFLLICNSLHYDSH
jgi:hypothetical protein